MSTTPGMRDVYDRDLLPGESFTIGKIGFCDIKFEDDNPDGELIAKFSLSGKGEGVECFLYLDSDPHVLKSLMRQAKVTKFSGLLGKPVKWYHKDGLLTHWKILEEVI